jgi:putative RecB family exonuclease
METISASQVVTYLLCPLKYRFQYVDRIEKPFRSSALAFGTSVHAAIEWFHRERIAGRTPDAQAVESIFAADWYAQNLEPLVFKEKESKEGLADMGRKMLQTYVQHALGEPVPLAVEESFEVDLMDPTTGELFDLRLRGRIDLLEEGETLVDVKTASRAFGSRGPELERHLQLSTYALVFLLRNSRIPKLRLDVLLKTKTPRVERLETARTVEDLAWTAHLIRRVAGSIASGRFHPNPGWICSECEYFAHCQAWRG